MNFKERKAARTATYESHKKKIFFTADWHVGHAKSIEYDERPFKDLDHMHRVLVNNYNSTVPDNGICYFLGDMGLASRETFEKIVGELNGTKILVLGNHDKGVNRMYNLGFDVVVFGLMIYIVGERVTLSHCPLLDVFREDTSHIKGDEDHTHWHGCNRVKNRKLSFSDEGQFHLHGHIHSRKGAAKSVKILDRQFDVGVPANDYRPVNISEIESWIANYKPEGV